jgi:hypothetical protein
MAKKTKSEEAKKTYDQRAEETLRGRAALLEAETDRTAAATAYAGDMSIAKRTKVETEDAKVAEAKLTLEALEAREASASAALSAARVADLEAELAETTKAADVDAAQAALHEFLVAPALAFDRTYAERIDEGRALLRTQREAVARGRELAAQLGRAFAVPELHLDDVRVVAGVAIAQARAAEGRGAGAELFLTPIDAAFVRQPGGMQVGNPLATIEQYEAAKTLLATKGS